MNSHESPKSTNRLLIRRLKPREATTLVPLVQEFFRVFGVTLPPPKARLLCRRAVVRPSTIVLLASRGRTPVGYAFAQEHFSMEYGGPIVILDDIYVRSSERRRGAGRQLILALQRHASSNQMARIEGEVEVANRPAQSMLLGLGFRLKRRYLFSLPLADR